MDQKPFIVGTGIDTVKINIKLLDGDGAVAEEQKLPEQMLTALHDWQEKALEKGKPIPTSMSSFHDARLMMFPNGAPAWKYIVRNDCLEIKLAPRLSMAMVAKITLQSSYLWEMGDIHKAIEEVRAFLRKEFGPYLALQMAQLDLCVDLVGLQLPTEWERMFLSQAKIKREMSKTEKDAVIYRGRELETVMFSGHGRPLSCKMYNKVLEIKQHAKEKTWFFPIWLRVKDKAGNPLWDGNAPVWRVEYSVEREGLGQMGFEGVDETILNIKRIWEYCTQEWLRMVQPGRTKNRARWATHPTWILLQHAFDNYGNEAVEGLGPIVRERRREKNIEQAVAAFAGYSTTYAAWEDMILDDDTCAPELFSLIYEKVLERWKNRGISPVDVIRDKKFIYSQVP